MGADSGETGGTPPVSDESQASVTRVSPSRRRTTSRDLSRLLDELSAQQASLARSVVLLDPEYLNHSFYLDPKSGKRIAHEIEPDELVDFLSSWTAAPLECIRALNRAVQAVPAGSRQERYIQAAIELEILMDRQSWTGDGQVYRGIPPYLMHGYTDMGGQASPTERLGREKIKIDKRGMSDRLADCKRQGVRIDGDVESLLAWYYDRVRQDIEFNESGVEKLSKDFGNESIVLSEYLEKGLGVCRHLSIFYQLYLQEAGIECRLIKGNLSFYIFKGRHAWNLVHAGDRVILVDVTHPSMHRPFMLIGESEEDVYAQAEAQSRRYDPTSDEQNYYKIGAA